jgi:hypothetical protein
LPEPDQLILNKHMRKDNSGNFRVNKAKIFHIIMIYRALIIVGLFAIILVSCHDEQSPESSFDLIQTRILNTSCAISGCHSSTDDNTFVQHQLVLAAGQSYKNLIDIPPTNPDAKADLLLRVKSGDAENSFFLHKLHGSHSHDGDYGSPMPLGLPLLSEGQVEFVRQWIDAGAPSGGVVADATLLDDVTPQAENFEPLEAPDAGKGIQLTISPFKVAPNFEREFFLYKKLNNTEPIYVNRIEIKMRQNSHHFILYDFTDMPEYFRPAANIIRDIRAADGTLIFSNLLAMEYHVFVAGTQTPYSDYKLPDGVAIQFPANQSLDMNSHYVNKSDKEIEGEVNVNLYTVPASEVQKVAKTLNLANQNLNIPAGQRVTISKQFTFANKMTIHTLTSHTHARGEKFVIKILGGIRNGEIVYTSTDWHHPLMANYNPPIVLQAGEGLVSEITYNNTTTSAIKFGLTSNDEMGIIFGYYTEN